jgi:protein-tyrosine phosphatase
LRSDNVTHKLSSPARERRWVRHLAGAVVSFFDRVFGHPDDGVFRRIPLESPGHLYTSPMPFGAYDRGNRILAIYRKHLIDHVIMLVTDEELDNKARRDLRKQYAAHGIPFSQFPFRDFHAPSLDAVEHVVEEASSRLGTQRIAVHCHAGVGRTAVAVSCIVMERDGLGPDEAITHVKNSMMVRMTTEQVELVRAFGSRYSRGGGRTAP